MTNIYTVGTTDLYDIINCDIGITEFYGVQLCSSQTVLSAIPNTTKLTLEMGSLWSETLTHSHTTIRSLIQFLSPSVTH
jgi:hypothetical protein